MNGMEAFFIRNKLYFREFSQKNQNQNGVFLHEFQFQKWYFLAIEQEKNPSESNSYLNLYIDDQSVKNLMIPF